MFAKRLAVCPTHTLIPLNLIMDERYSVYVRNEGVV
jgi:hypothetical protein